MFLVSKSCFHWSKNLFFLQKNMAEISGKGKTRQSYTIQFKKDVASYAVNTESLIVSGGCINYIQAPDLVWKKPFKAKIQEFYNDRLANGVHEYTTAGNMKPVPRRKIAH